jgi:hypothetical protein
MGIFRQPSWVPYIRRPWVPTAPAVNNHVAAITFAATAGQTQDAQLAAVAAQALAATAGLSQSAAASMVAAQSLGATAGISQAS